MTLFFSSLNFFRVGQWVVALSHSLSRNQAYNPSFATFVAADFVAADLGFSKFASLPIEWE